MTISELRDKRISEYLVRFISNYLTDRRIIIGKTPQRSVLGAVLWNVLYNGVLSLELTRGTECIAFADNVALVVGTCHENTLIENTYVCMLGPING